MTKKKIDEAATLNIAHSDGNLTSNTTFTAETKEELAMILKRAGIAGSSHLFNGPATLSIDNAEAGMSTTINGPDLRSVMQLLEPEFQAAAELEDAMVADLAAQEIEAELELADAPEFDDTECAMDYPVDAPEVVDVVDELPVASDDETASYDVPVDLEGDDETYEILDDDLSETAEYDYRTHEVGPRPYAGIADRKIVQPATKRVPARSSDNPIIENLPKTFADYVREAAECHDEEVIDESLLDEYRIDELSPETLASYKAKAQASKDHHEKRASAIDDMVWDSKAQEKVGRDPKVTKRVADARNREDRIAWKRERGLDRLANEDLALKSMGDHEIVFSDPEDDEIEAMQNDSPEKLAKVVKDISHDMHEADEEVAMRRPPPLPTDFNSVARRAKGLSKDGYVQHVDRHEDGSHSVSDWMSDNTVASFSNGRHHGGQDIDEAEEVSPEQKMELHKQLRDYHRENGNEEMAKRHDAILAKNNNV